MKRTVVAGLPLLLWLGWSGAAAFAAGETDKTESPYFFVEGAAAENQEAFPLKSTRVSATVSGVIANVTVKQTYENLGSTALNVRYVFPASTRAAVHGMTLRVGDKTVVARIKEREQATKEFEAAKREGKTASKLDQERPNVFTMSLANVMPKDRVEVELAYTELLIPTGSVYQFVYPTVVGPRYVGAGPTRAANGNGWTSMPLLRSERQNPAAFSIDVAISAGMPLAEVSSPSHAVTVTHERDSLARVALARSEGDAGNRDFILDYRLTGPVIGTGLLLYEGQAEKFFLLMVQPPKTVDVAAIPPREYIFVLDVSGSMNGFPLDTAKQVLRELISHLRPTDSFNVVLFSGAARLMAPSSVPASRANIERAIGVIDHESGSGSTELEGALGMAMKLPRQEHVSRTIAVFTDGYIAEEPGAFALVHKNLHDTNLFAFGIGSSVNRHLIEGLARAGQGEPFVVTDPSQAEETGQRFRRTVETPVLTDIHVKAQDFDMFDVEPSVQADLFAERPILVFGKWRGRPTGRLVVTGRTATGDFRASVEVAEHPAQAENVALPRLWARTRIARLSDFNFETNADEAVREVTNLGLTYSLVTKHTSFLAVLDRVRNRTAPAKDVTQPVPLPQGVSELAVDEQSYGSGAEPEVGLLALILGALALGSAVHKRRRAVDSRGRA